MEAGSSNSGQRPQKRHRQKRTSDSISYESSIENLSRAGKETLGLVNRKRPRPLNTIPNTSCAVFDNTCPDYNWLRCGWIAEERVKSHDRLYRYFYDPIGQMYSTREEVERICADIESNGVIILDKSTL